MHMCAQGSQKWALDPLELELQAFDVGAGIQTPDLVELQAHLTMGPPTARF